MTFPEDDDGGSIELELFRDPDVDDEAEERRPTETSDGAVPPPGFKPRPRPRRVVAVTGAKGGVGKTLLSTNLALYLATIGRRVVIVDVDADGSNAHTFLGVDRLEGIAPYVPPPPSFEPQPAFPLEALAEASAEEAKPEPTEEPSAPAAASSPEDERERPLRLVDTPVPGLSLVLVDEATCRRPSRRAQLLDRLAEIDAEYVVVDLGAGTTNDLVDFWLGADLSVFVTVPEPTAIENTYRFVRRAFARHLDRAAADVRSRRQLRRELRALGGAPSPLDVVRRLEARGDPLAALVKSAIASFAFRMVINQTRVRADLELGDGIQTAARRRLGVHVDYLGYVDVDDTVWSCVRMQRPLLVETPGTKASRSIEKIARRLVAIDAGKGPPRPVRSVPPESHHDLLDVDRGATDEEIRRAYKRVKEIYARDALCCYGLFDGAGIEALRARLDEAYDVLLDPARRRPYELSVFPPEPPLDDERPRDERTSEPRPPAPVITPDTEFTGSLLREVRESQGVDLHAVSQHTKVGVGYLSAIEADDFASLPALVYVRGFVTELAKYLKLDATQVSRTYVRRYRRYLDDHEKA